jgi:hypothetical protein
MNPEIEARITSEERREPGNKRLKCAKFELWALISAGITFTPRRVQDVEDEERRREALDELEQYGRIPAGHTSDKT